MQRYTERIDFSLPAETKVRLKAEAELEGISMSELIRRRVADFIGADKVSA